MNLLRNVAELLRKGAAEVAGGVAGVGQFGSKDDSGRLLPPPWPDVRFSTQDTREQSLAKSWAKHEQASAALHVQAHKASPRAASKAEESLQNFFEEFVRCFEAWNPTDIVSDISIPNQGSHNRITITGCSFGHPDKVLRAMISALRQAVRSQSGLASERDEDMSSTLFSSPNTRITLLHALSIAMRSSHNRRVFSFYQGFPVLMRVTKAAVMQLKALAGDIRMHGVSLAQGTLLTFLQCLLAYAVSVIASFTDAEARWEQWRSSGDVATVDVLQEPIVPMVETGSLSLIIELLRVLRNLRFKQVIKIADNSLEELVLKTLGAMLAGSSTAQSHLRTIGGLEVLMDGIGWPPLLNERKAADDEVKREFSTMLLYLRVLREAVVHHASNLQHVQDSGGMRRIVAMMRWTAVSFLGTNQPSIASISPRKVAERILLGQSHLQNTGRQVRDSNPMAELLETLYSFISDNTQLSSHAGISSSSSVAGPSVLEQQLLRQVVLVMLRTFQTDMDDTPRDVNVLTMLRTSVTALQHDVLHMLTDILVTRRFALPICRDCGMWDALFSDAFFFHGETSGAGEDATDQSIVHIDDFTQARPESACSPSVIALRRAVMAVVEVAATVPYAEYSNAAECSKLLELLKQHAAEPEIAQLLASCLCSVLRRARASTIASFKSLNASAALASALLATQSATSLVANQARSAIVDLLGDFLDSSSEVRILAVKEPSTISALFLLLEQPALEQVSLRRILDMLKLPVRSAADEQAKAALVTKYLEALPRAQAAVHTRGIGLIVALLNGMTLVLQSDVPYYQNLFRQAECFVHIVNLLNEEYTEADASRLSIEVLATLTQLVAGNDLSKATFRSLVGSGYGTLMTVLMHLYDEKPSEALIQALFDMLLDGSYSTSGDEPIQNVDAVILLFGLLERCEEPVQLAATEKFLHLIDDNIANQSACDRADLLSLLMRWFPSVKSPVLQAKCASLLQTCAHYSIKGKELLSFFVILRKAAEAADSEEVLHLLHALQSMARSEGPPIFFNMDGKESGLTVSGPLKWPGARGYTFCTWLRMEAYDAGQMDRNLFRFTTPEGTGCAASVRNGKFVLQCLGTDGAKVAFHHQLAVHRWYFVAISHSAGRALSPSTAKLFINGEVASAAKLRYPRVAENTASGSFGAGWDMLNLRQLPFAGQLGPLYLFEDALSDKQLQAVFRLGPEYMYSFLPHEIGHVTKPAAGRALHEGKDALSGKVVLSFNARACSGVVCLNTSLGSNGQRCNAQVLPGTQLCSTSSARSCISALGGMSALLPLLTLLELPPTVDSQDQGGTQSEGLGAAIIGVFSAMLAGSQPNQEDMLGGFALAGHLLRQYSPDHLSMKALHALLSLISVITTNGKLLQEVFAHLLLNASLWVYTSFEVQKALWGALSNYAGAHEGFRDLCSVQQLLDTSRWYYGEQVLTPLKSRPLVTWQCKRPVASEVTVLRQQLLRIVEVMLRSEVSQDEAQALLAFMGDCSDAVVLDDILQLMHNLFSHPTARSSIGWHVSATGGPYLFLPLLSRGQERIRILGLGLISACLRNLQRDHQAGSDLFSSITESIVVYPFTENTMTALWDIMFGATNAMQALANDGQVQVSADGVSSQATNAQAASPDKQEATASGASKIVCAQAFGTMCKLLLACDDANITCRVLGQAAVSLENNYSNCAAVLAVSGWQEWLFPLLSGPTRCSPQERLAQRTAVLRLFAVMHTHCVLRLGDGWRQLDRSINSLLMFAQQAVLDATDAFVPLLTALLTNVLDMAGPVALSQQPARENLLFVIMLVDEFVINCLATTLAGPVTRAPSGTAMKALHDLLEQYTVPPPLLQPDICSATIWSLIAKTWQLLLRLLVSDGFDHSARGRAGLGQRAKHALQAWKPHGSDSRPRLRGSAMWRVIARVVLLQVEKADLDQAQASVSMFQDLMPALVASDSEGTVNRMHLLLWSLLDLQQEFVGTDAARADLVAHLLISTCEEGKALLLSTADQQGLAMEPLAAQQHAGPLAELVQRDRAIRAIREEAKVILKVVQQRSQACDHLHLELHAATEVESRAARSAMDNCRQHIAAVCEADAARRMTASAVQDEEQRSLASKWQHLNRALSSERGPWAKVSFSGDSQPTTRWKLDTTEDPWRRRLRLKQHYRFKPYPRQTANLKSSTEPSEEDAAVVAEGLKIRARPPSLELAAGDDFEMVDDPGPDYRSKQSNLDESDTGDKILFTQPCALINPKNTSIDGRLEITHSVLHFYGIADIVPPMSPGRAGGSLNSQSQQIHKRWDVTRLREVHFQRYLLQSSALEFFFEDRSTVLLNFSSVKSCKQVAARVHALNPSSIIFLDRRRKQELAEKLRDRWRRRELTNYEYLMHLNTLAGRTYNDLSQYPVFPWVLSDYTSSTLDLASSSIYRDLSKPVGALNPTRLEFFLDRYRNFSDPNIPRFHYGSHYSSAGIVLFYLIRLEPFTRLNWNLQGGKFDHADRLFQSVPNSFQNVLNNSSDVKELTPEFFYLPDMFCNPNGLHLGYRQDGTPLNEVELPPWANGNAAQFVRINRAALESEYVSERLHLWIDLIFGYKQTGEEAVKANNLFFYLTYEGQVDMNSVSDSLERAAIEAQISNFGQTPVQLFSKKHPQRGPPLVIFRPLSYCPNAIRLTSVGTPYTNQMPMVYITVTDGRIVTVNKDSTLACHKWLTPHSSNASAFTFSAAQESSFGVEPDTSPQRRISALFTGDADLSPLLFGTLWGGRLIISCGHWDNSFKVATTDEGRVVQSIAHHKDVVTCLSIGNDGHTLATGSKDTTVIVWEKTHARPQAIGGSARQGAPKAVVQEKPKAVLYGHDDYVTCVAVCSEMDLVVSGSADGTCILHTIRDSRYLRSITHPDRGAIMLVAASMHGCIVMYSLVDLALHAYTVNGTHLASEDAAERLTVLSISADGNYLLTGGERGCITARLLPSLKVARKYEGTGVTICSLSVTPEDCFLAGLQDGSLLVFSLDPVELRKGSTGAL
eukprot:jgi/Chlat1/301/Chrsp1S08783